MYLLLYMFSNCLALNIKLPDSPPPLYMYVVGLLGFRLLLMSTSTALGHPRFAHFPWGGDAVSVISSAKKQFKKQYILI